MCFLLCSGGLNVLFIVLWRALLFIVLWEAECAFYCALGG